MSEEKQRFRIGDCVEWLGLAFGRVCDFSHGFIYVRLYSKDDGLLEEAATACRPRELKVIR